jgi:hypothetical protein
MSWVTVLVGVSVASAVVAAIRLTWKVRTVSAFLAGAAAGTIVVVDPDLWVVTAISLAAVGLAVTYAVRTTGTRTDDGVLTAWVARFGASWLVLAFPAGVVWVSVQVATWILHRL